MAYNLIVESKKHIPWDEVHKDLFKEDMNVELIPMPGQGEENGDALGICIPMDKANEKAWNELSQIITYFLTRQGVQIVDLFQGQVITNSNIDSTKRNILG
jgi:hypothetical protein